MSKGSGRRPKAISDKQMADNWDRIFKKGKADAKQSGVQKKLSEGVR